MGDRFYDLTTIILTLLGLLAIGVYLLTAGKTGGNQSGSVHQSTAGNSQQRQKETISSEPQRNLEENEVIRFTLKTGFDDGHAYIGSSGAIQGQANPDLLVREGNTVIIRLKNNQDLGHNLVVPAFDSRSNTLYFAGDNDIIQFRADRPGTFAYYCSVASHRSLGMEGKLIVEEIK